MFPQRKSCTKCGELKSLNEFHLRGHGESKDGHKTECKDCSNKRTRLYTRSTHGKKAIAAHLAKPEIQDERKEWRRKYLVIPGNKKRQQELSSSPEQKGKREKWRLRNPEKMAVAAASYLKRYPARNNAKAARARATRIQRTPAWADQAAIRFWYEFCPEGCEVDHIIPLRGGLVSGLHVESNLQWLPVAENRRKGNEFVPAT